MSVYLKCLRYTVLMESAVASGDYYVGDKKQETVIWRGLRKNLIWNYVCVCLQFTLSKYVA
jgi:hypothetical protein